MIVDQNTQVEALIGGTYRTENFAPFTILSGGQEPGITAIGYGARDLAEGYAFVAFLPWGKELIPV